MYKVLLVDDEALTREAIGENIPWGELGFELVEACENGRDAMEAIRQKKPDLVLTDIRMPGYDGMELLKRARIQNPDMEFIIISGYSHFEYMRFHLAVSGEAQDIGQ